MWLIDFPLKGTPINSLFYGTVNTKVNLFSVTFFRNDVVNKIDLNNVLFCTTYITLLTPSIVPYSRWS